MCTFCHSSRHCHIKSKLYCRCRKNEICYIVNMTENLLICNYPTPNIHSVSFRVIFLLFFESPLSGTCNSSAFTSFLEEHFAILKIYCTIFYKNWINNFYLVWLEIIWDFMIFFTNLFEEILCKKFSHVIICQNGEDGDIRYRLKEIIFSLDWRPVTFEC